MIVFLMAGRPYFPSERAECTRRGILPPFYGFGGRLPKTPCMDTKEKGCEALGERVEDQRWEAAGGRGSPFFKPPLAFVFQAPADREQQSEGQGFLPQLHPAPEGCGEAQDQQRYRNGSLLSRGPAPRWGTVAWLKHAPHRAALKSFLLSQLQRGILASC